MIRVIIWGTGRVYSQFARRIQCGVELGEFEVVGVTSEDTWCRTIDGFPFLAKETVASVPSEKSLLYVFSDRFAVGHVCEAVCVVRQGERPDVLGNSARYGERAMPVL